MNHPFQQAAWNKLICSKCLKNESVHGSEVTCDACNNVGQVELIGKLLLCSTCAQKESEIITEPKLIEQTEAIDKFLERIDKLAESNTIKNIMDSAIKGNIKEYKDFFNADIPSIIALKDMIESDVSISNDDKKYALARALSRRITYLTMVLFNFRTSEVELSAEVKSIQFYVRDLIPQLRMKLRQEFQANTPNYTPQVIKTSVPKVKGKKLSTEDKLAESYAKMMKIPIEQAKRLLANKLRDDCTCSETPGMCKVHN